MRSYTTTMWGLRCARLAGLQEDKRERERETERDQDGAAMAAGGLASPDSVLPGGCLSPLIGVAAHVWRSRAKKKKRDNYK